MSGLGGGAAPGPGPPPDYPYALVVNSSAVNGLAANATALEAEATLLYDGSTFNGTALLGDESAVNGSSSWPAWPAWRRQDLCDWLANHSAAAELTGCSSASPLRVPLELCPLANETWPQLFPRDAECLARAPFLEHGDVVRAAFLVFLALVAVVGNVYTIRSIRRKSSPSPMYKLILHLSVADVLVSLVCILGEAVWMLLVAWPFGNAACKMFKFLEMATLHGSSYVIVLIAQNRCVAVSHPLASRASRRSRGPDATLRDHLKDVLRCASPRAVLFVWAVGVCLSVPQLFMFSVQRGPFFEPFYQCVTYGTSQASERVYNIVNFITLFVIPLLGLSLSYASIYCTLSKGQRAIRSLNKTSIPNHDQNRQRSMKRAKAKSRKIAVTIVVFYLVSWLPYYVTMLVFFLTPAGRDTWYTSIVWMDWIFFFGMANSVVNPAIYSVYQLRSPKRQKQWSCLRQRDGSTQLTQFTDSFRRHAAFVAGLTPVDPATLEAANGNANGNGNTNGGANGNGSCALASAAAEPSLPLLPLLPLLPALGKERGQLPPAATVALSALVPDTTLSLLGGLPALPALSEAPAAPAALAPSAVIKPAASAALTAAAKAEPFRPFRPFSWRRRFLRKYWALRSVQAHPEAHAAHGPNSAPAQ